MLEREQAAERADQREQQHYRECNPRADEAGDPAAAWASSPDINDRSPVSRVVFTVILPDVLVPVVMLMKVQASARISSASTIRIRTMAS